MLTKLYLYATLIAAAFYALSASGSEPRFPTQGQAAARYLTRWIERLERRVESAYQEGSMSGPQYDRLQERVAHVRGLARVALRDNLVTAAEREVLRHAIGLINMDVAEARFGPGRPSPERWTRRDPLRPANKPKPVESGTGTVISAN
jgi:hypothetical protein